MEGINRLPIGRYDLSALAELLGRSFNRSFSETLDLVGLARYGGAQSASAISATLPFFKKDGQLQRRSVMTSNPVSALTVALLLIGAAADRYCNADTIIPVTQDRFTSVLLDTDCDGQTSAGEAAAGFEPFDSSVDTSQQCPLVPIFAFANANQNSTIGGSSMTLFANAVYSVQTPGSALASAISNFIVTFELPRTSIVSFEGVLLGDGPVPGVETTAQLTGPTGEMLFFSTLTGPFPFGEATEQSIDEELTLEPRSCLTG